MADTADQEKKKSWLWPKIDDEASAFESAKAGAVGGGLMLAALLLSFVLVYFSQDAAVLGWDDMQSFYIWQAVQVVLVAFLTWRVYTGKGRFASILLLIWVLLEVAMKAVAGHLNVGWAIMWLFAILSLVHSVRGSWALRKYRQTASA